MTTMTTMTTTIIIHMGIVEFEVKEEDQLTEFEQIIDSCTELNISEKIQLLLIQYEYDIIKEKNENVKQKIITIGQSSHVSKNCVKII